jgi:hypothetical protein
MRGQQGLIADRDGALHIIEGVIAALLLFSALACLQSISGPLSQENSDDVDQLSTDLLYILEHSENRPGHPGLAQALSSQSVWLEQSPALESDLCRRMPAGYMAYLQTPYGDAGDCPPDLAVMSLRPFLAYRQETGEMIGCNLLVWRP